MPIKLIAPYEGIEPTFEKSTIEECFEYCSSKKILGVDTETEGFDFLTKKMIMLQIGDEDTQFVIDTRFVDVQILKPIFESDDIIKIFHNAKFDYKFLKHWAGFNTVNIYDTYLAEKVMYCGYDDYGFGLKNLCERYLNVTLKKDERGQFVGMTGQPFTDSQIVYGAKDIEYLIKIREKQQDRINYYDLEIVVDLENRAVIPFSEIEYEGLILDQDAWRELAVKNKVSTEAMLCALDELVLKEPKLQKYKQPMQGDLFNQSCRQTHINWDSPKQVLECFCLFEPMESVNGKYLLKFRNKYPLVKEYIKYKETSKLANAYGEEFFKFIKSDGKIHTNFNQILATGRVSSSDPNMQQMPASNLYRNCFIAPEDWVFVSSDYSSQELNVIAYGSKDPVFLKALENGEDLHSVCAELVFGQEWIDASESDCLYVLAKQKCNCKKHKVLRNAVKSINFGLAYGMGPFKLADTLEISTREASDLIEKYFAAFPSIRRFLNMLGKFGTANGYIQTFKPFRRKRWFSAWDPAGYTPPADLGAIERKSKNTPIQGASADMTKLALVMIHHEIVSNWEGDVKLVMTVHDQIDTICKKEVADKWKVKMTELMEEAANTIVTNELLKADTNISERWEK